MSTVAVTVVVLAVVISLSLLAQQNRYALKVADGLAFSDFKGYDMWQDIAVGETGSSVKAILGDPRMIKAYKEGIPDNGKTFPEGSRL